MSLTLHESAALVGGHCWIERRLFERLGAWSQRADAPAAKRVLDRHAQHAAWRAEQWWARLPVLAQVDRDGLVAGPEGWAGALADRDDEAAGILLAVTYRALLPRLSSRYLRHRDLTDPLADGPVIRTLAQALTDVQTDWAEGERLLEDLMATGAGTGEASAAIGAVDIAFGA